MQASPVGAEKNMQELGMLKLSGTIAGIWMTIGVICVARLYPNYSHTHQVMSELGARGRATERIHPLINNFPLAFLYMAFGIAVALSFLDSLLGLTSGVLIVVHGACHAVTGAYPCDKDLGIPKASAEQLVHNIAGLVMLSSLLGAGVLWTLAPASVVGDWFRWFSAACCAVSLVFFLLMGHAFRSGFNVGLYQRIGYGALVLWASVFSGVIYVRA